MYRYLTILLLLSTGCEARPPQSGTAVSQEQAAQSRYDELKQRYESTAARNPEANRYLAKEARLVERARKKRDIGALMRAMDRLEEKLNELDPAPTTPPTNAPTVPTPVESANTESALYDAERTTPEIGKLFAHKGQAENYNRQGGLSRNRKKYVSVAFQRDALWTLRKGLLEKNPDDIKLALQAYAYSFEFLTDEGYFKNGLGLSPIETLNADAFFLASVFHAYNLLDQTGHRDICERILDPLKPNMQRSLDWLKKNRQELHRQDHQTPNRLFFDATAFLLGGKLLNDNEALRIGKEFLNNGLAMQQPNGMFLEHGGGDSSYQAVCLVNLSILWFHISNESDRERIYKSLEKGMQWEAQKIADSGKVSAEGNSRTGLGQEKFLGKVKEINYAEVALACYYWANISGESHYLQKADAIIRYLEQAQ